MRCTSEAQQADHGALLVAHAQLLARHCIVRAVQTVESKEHQRTEKRCVCVCMTILSRLCECMR